MFEGIYFEFPKMFFVFFFFLACDALCKMREQGFYYPHLDAFASVTVKPSYWLWLLKWASISLLIVALMSPVKDKVYQPQGMPGYAVALVVDTSTSMRNGGFDPHDNTKSRFEAAQEILEGFVRRRGSDVIGLVAFGTHAFIASPPTADTGLLARIIDQLYVGIAGKYTALYEAAAKGVVLLHDTKSREKIVILLSDGRNTPGAPLSADTASALAKKEGARLYAIAIGDTPAAQEETLEKMAKNTGGHYFRATDASALLKVFAQIDRLERSPQRPPMVTIKEYFYIYPLFLGFLTLLLYVYWRNRRVS